MAVKGDVFCWIALLPLLCFGDVSVNHLFASYVVEVPLFINIYICIVVIVCVDNVLCCYLTLNMLPESLKRLRFAPGFHHK